MQGIDTVIVDGLVLPAAQMLMSGSEWYTATSRRKSVWVELGDIKAYEALDRIYNSGELVEIAYIYENAIVAADSGVIKSMDIYRVGFRLCSRVCYQYDLVIPGDPRKEKKDGWLRLAGKLGAFPDRLAAALKADIATLLGIVPEVEYCDYYVEWDND